MVKTIYLCFQDNLKIHKKLSESNIKKKIETKDTLKNLLAKFQKPFKISYQEININKKYEIANKNMVMKNFVIPKEFKQNLHDFYFCNNNILFIKAINLHVNF